jgi:hypothetical protein
MLRNRIIEITQRISESAFDFLSKSLDEIEKHPKYAVIHFATAVELLLKARLMHGHWSLVVENVTHVELEKFLSGECKTVTPGDAVRRLSKVCGQSISKEAATQFDKIAAHRNRMIHFFHEAGLEEADRVLAEKIVKEQYLCWFYLEQLLKQWRDQFARFDTQVDRARGLMRRNRSYLSAAFEGLRPEIIEDEKQDSTFNTCSGCMFKAAEVNKLSEVFYQQKCRVCELSETYVEIDCPAGCGHKIHIEAEHDSKRTCNSCGYDVTASDLEDILDTESADPVDFTSKSCALCCSHGSVVLHNDIYVCVECLSTSHEIAFCEWCNEGQMGGGDLDGSHYSGCEFCDGQAGWIRDD